MDNYIRHLQESEADAIIRVMAFMSYNPSIGRVLEKGGVKRFQEIAVKLSKKLSGASSRETFDKLHDEHVQMIVEGFTTSRTTRPSYGQAQKPINVFLKVYVDWAGRPNPVTRDQLLPYLHVPLDSIVMETIKSQCRDWYRNQIRPCVTPGPQEFSLSKIDKNIYLRWQSFFRQMHPEKPILFDVAWALNRE